jgi:hypothetical protein
MAQAGSLSATYADVDATARVSVNIQVVPRAIVQSEQIARYFTEDLEKFIEDTHIDLMQQLDIPPYFAQSSREVLEMLSDDLAHMLRDSLITGIHLLLSNPHIDPNIQAYPLRYHAEYTITTIRSNDGGRDITPARPASEYIKRRTNGYLKPPDGSWIGAKFALLIDWNTSLSERRRTAGPPYYFFDWVPKNEVYEATSQVRFREGGMELDGVEVVHRREWKSPGFK